MYKQMSAESTLQQCAAPARKEGFRPTITDIEKIMYDLRQVSNDITMRVGKLARVYGSERVADERACIPYPERPDYEFTQLAQLHEIQLDIAQQQSQTLSLIRLLEEVLSPVNDKACG